MDTYVVLWLLFLGVWMIAAVFLRKSSVRRDSSARRFVYGLLVPVGAFLVVQQSSFRPLPIRLLPAGNQDVHLSGIVIAAAGMAFAIWARLALGRNWSGVVTVKADHELIRSGPYRFVRHPIYSGILTSFMGTAIGRGSLLSFIGLAIAFCGLRMKWRTEERFMVEEFGTQ